MFKKKILENFNSSSLINKRLNSFRKESSSVIFFFSFLILDPFLLNISLYLSKKWFQKIGARNMETFNEISHKALISKLPSFGIYTSLWFHFGRSIAALIYFIHPLKLFRLAFLKVIITNSFSTFHYNLFFYYFFSSPLLSWGLNLRLPYHFIKRPSQQLPFLKGFLEAANF